MCPSSTPLSFIDLSACCVQTLRPSTFKSTIFFRSSGEPSAEHKSELDPLKQLLHGHMRVNVVIRLLTYFASLCEEGLCRVLRVICVTGSVHDGSLSLDTANKIEWFHMSFCLIAHRFMLFPQLASSCLSVCPQGKLGSHGADFYEISYLCIFRKIWEKIQI